MEGAADSARLAGIPHERLDASEITRRWPGLAPPAEGAALFEPGAGALDPEGCVSAHLELAVRAGAEVAVGESVRRWTCLPGGVRVETGRRTLEVGALVLTVGPWAPGLLEGLAPSHAPAAHLEVERQVTGRFGPRGEGSLPQLPILLVDRGDQPMLYAIPEADGTLKAGLHHGGERAPTPSGIRREATQDDEVRIALPLAEVVPSVAPRWLDGAVCLYTNAPRDRWLVGALPGHPGVFLASACSGHGFKVSSAVGEALAALALGRRPAVDLSPFDPGGGE